MNLPAELTEPLAPAAEQYNELEKILLFVCDTASADAAAPRIAALNRQRAEQGLEVLSIEPFFAYVCIGSHFFDSMAFQKALEPQFPPPALESLIALRPYDQVLREVWFALNDAAEKMDAVQDKASADAAGEHLENMQAFMLSQLERYNKLAPLKLAEDRELLRRSYICNTLPFTAKALRSLGHLLQRSDTLYDSDRLIEGVLLFLEVLENMNVKADPDTLAIVMTTSELVQPKVHELIHLLELVKDRESADAVAPQISRILEDIQALVRAQLGYGFERDLIQVQPPLGLQVFLADRISGHLNSLQPPCYGSEQLRSVLTPPQQEASDEETAEP